MARIYSLKPNVAREEAIGHFSPGGPWELLRAVASGPLRSLADFYIPFQLFQVEILNGGKREQRIFGLDAVNGNLDLYHFEQPPGPDDLVCVETRNCPPALLDGARARDLIIAKVQRLLFSSGFFRLRDLHISAEPLRREIYVPYWVGFRGRQNAARLVVMDAVRRRMEGAKVRQILESWLRGAM
jgi:hypothetical protein